MICFPINHVVDFLRDIGLCQSLLLLEYLYPKREIAAGEMSIGCCLCTPFFGGALRLRALQGI